MGRGTGTDRRRAIIVLGVHRSGTSALTRVMNLLGATVASDIDPPDEFNSSGYWEPRSIRSLNDSVLGAMGLTWSDWAAPRRPLSAGERAQFLADALRCLDAEFGQAPLIVMKDPRICRLMPFWIEALEQAGIDPVIVLPVRDPREVAGSLARREYMSLHLAQAIWLRNLLEAEAHTREVVRCFTNFNELFDDWRALIDRIAAQTGLPLDWRSDREIETAIDGFLDPAQRHFRQDNPDTTPGTRLERLAEDAYRTSQALSADPNQQTILRHLDEVKRTLDEASSQGRGAPTIAARLERLHRSVGRGEAAGSLGDELDLLALETDMRASELHLVAAGGEDACHPLRNPLAVARADLARTREELDQTRQDQDRLRHDFDLESARREREMARLVEIDTGLRAVAQRVRDALAQPGKTIGLRALSQMLKLVSKSGFLPDARRDRIARSALKRDPAHTASELRRLADELHGVILHAN